MPRVKPFSRDAVKGMAVLAMTGNHAAQALMAPGAPGREALVDLGYVTAVTMCWFLVEGYFHTRSKAAYALRLLVFGVVSQPVYQAALSTRQLNMLFTLFFCLLLVWVMDAFAGRWYRLPAALVLVLATAWCDWPLLAAGFTLLFVLARPLGRAWNGLCFAMAAVLFWAFQLSGGMDPGRALLSCLGIPAAGAVILLLCSQQRSAFALRHPALSKYFFYLYYPAHLALLALLRR